MNVFRKGGRGWRRAYALDIFHTLVNKPTWQLVAVVTVLYLFTIFFFAVLLWMASACVPEATTLMRAMFFSVETLITIGYSATDVTFNSCPSVLIIIIAESIVSVLLDALALGLVFQRFSRAQTRARTILFTSSATLASVRGHTYLIFQVCDRRQHQLLEAHVRCYALAASRSRDNLGRRPGRLRAMRLQRPNDELGADLLLQFPSAVVHRVDAWSPLHPRCGAHDPLDVTASPADTYRFPDILQRQADVEAGVREGTAAEAGPTPQEVWRAMKKQQVEVLCIVEGIDMPTAATVQATHSYVAEEVRLDRTFAPCLFADRGAWVIDFDAFHRTLPLQSGTETTGPNDPPAPAPPAPTTLGVSVEA